MNRLNKHEITACDTDLTPISRAIDLGKTVLHVIHGQDSMLSPRLLLVICRLYRSLYERTGALGVLDELILHHHQLISSLGDMSSGNNEDQEYCDHLVFLADALLEHFHEIGNQDSRKQALILLQTVLDRRPDHEHALLAMTDALVESHTISWDGDALRTALDHIGVAKRMITEAHTLWARLNLTHGWACAAQYLYESCGSYAKDAELYFQRAIEGKSNEHIKVRAIIGLLELQRSIRVYGGTQHLPSHDPRRMLDMGQSFRSLPQHLKMEIRLGRAKYAVGEPDSSLMEDVREIWSNHSHCQLLRLKALRLFCSIGLHFFLLRSAVIDFHDLRKHIQAGIDESASMPFYRALFFQCKSLARVSEPDASLDDLEESISVARKSVDICPKTSLFYTHALSTLQWASGSYFHRSGNSSVLDELIRLVEENLEQACNYPLLVANLALSMLDRAKVHSSKSRKTHLVSRSFEVLRHLDAQKLAGRDKLIYLDTISSVYESEEDLGLQLQHTATDRMQLAQECLELELKIGTEHTAAVIKHLVKATFAYACQSGQIECIAHATVMIERVLQSTRLAAGTERAEWLALQGEASVITSRINGSASSKFDSGWSVIRSAVYTEGLDVLDALRMARRWARLAENSGDLETASEAYNAAVQFLPRVAYLGQDVVGRMQALRQAQDLATRAATNAISRGQIPSAINLLEQTRGVLWSQALHMRAPLDHLPPSQASHLRRLILELEINDGLAPADRRMKANEFDEMITSIRQDPKFCNFLQPQKLNIEALSASLVPSREFVAVIISGAQECNVIILGVTGVPHVHLCYPMLDEDRLLIMAQQFTKETSRSRNTAADMGLERKVQMALSTAPSDQEQPECTLLLEELWNTLVHDVVKALCIPRTSGCDRPRLWWCIAGALTCLPFHAAGIYTGNWEDSVSNYVASSYTPTLLALQRLKEDVKRCSAQIPDKILMLAQSDAPDVPRIAKAEEELALVRQVVGMKHFIDIPTDANVDVGNALIVRLQEAAVLHLACHAKQDRDDPLKSGFVLESGHLTLGQLMQARAPKAKLAYLSACESAAMDENQPDEVINLAATMLFVGFKSVIATLWSMNDVDGPFMAERIYRSIFKAGMLDLAAIPYALDDAVQQLRDSGAHASRWATYVHIGV